MNYKISSFKLDLSDVCKPIEVPDCFKEHDSVIFRVGITNKGNPVSLFGKTVRFFAVKPDKEVVYQIENINVADPISGIVDVRVTPAALNVYGKVTGELEIVNQDGTLMTTSNFTFSVVDKLNNLDTDEEVVENIDFLKEIQEFVVSTRPEETNRQNQEKQRKADEQARLSAEEIRVQNELDRQASFSDMEQRINVGITNSDIDTIISNALA